jgi:hypothetical protein
MPHSSARRTTAVAPKEPAVAPWFVRPLLLMLACGSVPLAVFGRNPRYRDTSLFKTFKLTESKSFDFRAQVYNLANTPSFNTPNTNTNLATGGHDAKSAPAVRVRPEVQLLKEKMR